jgi:hypothetical protein
MATLELTIHSADGTRQVSPRGGRTTIGRGKDAAVCINDQGLSRLHASIYCEGDKVWIIDERSTNGVFVNGERVTAAGRPLANGDKIEMGDQTIMWAQLAASANGKPAGNRRGLALRPRAAVYLPIVFVLLLAGFFSLRLLRNAGANGETRAVPPPAADGVAKDAVAKDAVEPAAVPPPVDKGSEAVPQVTTPPAVVNRLYQAMSPAERMEFVRREAARVSEIIGTRPCNFTEEVLRMIKVNVDAYANRVGQRGEDRTELMRRARKYAPLIIRAFRQEGVKPEIGLYIAMIESEYSDRCVSSPAAARGMFQFIASTARLYGVTNPADVCDPKVMAPAAARYVRDRLNEFGQDATSVGLAIAGYNRSPDSVRRDLHTILNETGERRERSFWTLVAHAEKLDHWFQENMKYVPKFYAAAIIGENPQYFGLQMRQLSTYSDESEPR